MFVHLAQHCLNSVEAGLSRISLDVPVERLQKAWLTFSVYLLRFQHYATFGIRLQSGTFPALAPPLTGACDVFMNSHDADMLEVRRVSSLWMLSCLKRESVARRQAQKTYTGWSGFWCMRSIGGLYKRQVKLVLYEEIILLHLHVKTCCMFLTLSLKDIWIQKA